MRRELLFVFVAAFALYLPAAGYGFVQDDRAIIVSNPAAHSIPAALAAFDDPYWPRESGAGLYRPLAILSYAVDWTVSDGRAGWFHVMNALWHGLATVLLVLILMRWLPTLPAAGAGLVFAWHPVHVEAVASLVGRAELLVAVAIFGAVLAARRGQWTVSVVCAAAAMLSKEHGVIAPVVILFDNWLDRVEVRRLPITFLVALGAVTIGFLVAWLVIGAAGAHDVAAVFYGRGTLGRLAVALPAVVRAAALLVWPVSLSSDYDPQVIAAREGFSAAAALGIVIVIGLPVLIVWSRRRAPAIAFTAVLAILSYLPTANLLFPSGVVLAERNLYLAGALPAALAGAGVAWLSAHRGLRPAAAALAVVALACGMRSVLRLPAWRDNRSQLLTLLTEHPESYRGHASAAAVLAGRHDTAAARREYHAADSLFAGDPYLDAGHALFLIGVGDTAAARPLIDRARSSERAQRIVWRAQFLLSLARHDQAGAAALVDSVRRRYSEDTSWYLMHFH
jgi:protein O-mannosyl-transferase